MIFRLPTKACAFCVILASTVAVCDQTALAVVTFNWVAVGNAGNSGAYRGFGAVDYDFSISKYEVTNAQYVEFLNAVGFEEAYDLGLVDQRMLYYNTGGLATEFTTSGPRYLSKTGRENHPVTSVSWLSAARFINWLQNGQGDADTESGVYNLSLPADQITRQADADYFIPTENEWYKAAYHNPANTGPAYFSYATGSNDRPISDRPQDNPAAVNHFYDDGIANGFNDGYAVSGTTSTSGVIPFTDVGAYTDAASPYGTYDQNGNAMEWTETRFQSGRIVRGGSAGDNSSLLHAFTRYLSPEESIVHDYLGFRVASFMPASSPNDPVITDAISTVNIDFGAIGTGPNNSYAGAGLAGYWNQIDEITSTPRGGIRDESGNLTGITLSATQNLFDVTPQSQPFGQEQTPLLGDYLVSARNNFTLDIQGLPVGGYYVIVYTTSRQDYPHQSTVTPFGWETLTAINTGIYDGELEQGITHSIHQVYVRETGLTLDIYSPADAFINGIQLLFIPEPGTIGLVIAGAGMMLRRWRC